MRIKFFSIISVGMLFFSCATYHFIPIPDRNIEIQEERGNSYPIFEDGQVRMMIIPEYLDTELVLKISLKNLTVKNLSFNDSDFEISVSDDRLTWTKMKIYSSSEYYKKEKNEYITGAAVMVLNAVASSYNAGRGYSTTRGNVYGSTGYGSYSGSYTSSTTYYDPAAAELARQSNIQAISNYSQNGKSWLDLLENNLFYSAKIGPSEEYFGLVFAKKRSGRYYRIICRNPSINIISIDYERVED